MAGAESLEAVMLAPGGVDLGVDETGSDGIDTDVVRSELIRQSECEGVDGAFDAADSTYSSGLPMRAAADEKFTIAPPAWPRRVEIRRIASRAHGIGPTTLTANILRTRSLDMSSTLSFGATMPALFTRASSSPSNSSADWKKL
jgi:hypothetical protein